MNKALLVAVILLGIVALSNSRSAGTSNTGFTSAVIVAQGQLRNQTAPIPATTIFTPAAHGLYRFSAYATLISSNPMYGTERFLNLSWTDDAGPQTAPVLWSYDLNAGQFWQGFGFSSSSDAGQGNPLGGSVTTFEAKANQPITYSVTQVGNNDGLSYSLYYALERL